MARLTRKQLEELWEEATDWPADNALGRGVLDHILGGAESEDAYLLSGHLASVIEDIRALKREVEETH